MELYSVIFKEVKEPSSMSGDYCIVCKRPLTISNLLWVTYDEGLDKYRIAKGDEAATTMGKDCYKKLVKKGEAVPVPSLK